MMLKGFLAAGGGLFIFLFLAGAAWICVLTAEKIALEDRLALAETINASLIHQLLSLGDQLSECAGRSRSPP